jgi:hypothetical protein
MPRFQQLRFFVAKLHGMRGGRTELNCLGGLPLLEEIDVEYWCGHAAIDLGTSFPTGALMQPLLSYLRQSMLKGLVQFAAVHLCNFGILRCLLHMSRACDDGNFRGIGSVSMTSRCCPDEPVMLVF